MCQNDQKLVFRIIWEKKFLFEKMNSNMVSDNVIDLRKNFIQIWCNLGRKNFLSVIWSFDHLVTKNQKIWPNLVLEDWNFVSNPIFVWGIRKKWSRDDLPILRFQVMNYLQKLTLKEVKFYFILGSKIL